MRDAEKPSRVRHYKDLVVWQRAMQLVKSVYNLTKTFPPDERFGLALQRFGLLSPDETGIGQQ